MCLSSGLHTNVGQWIIHSSLALAPVPSQVVTGRPFGPPTNAGVPWAHKFRANVDAVYNSLTSQTLQAPERYMYPSLNK